MIKKQNKKLLRVFMILCIIALSPFILTAQSEPGLGDVNDDGALDIVDALLVAQYYVGLIDELSPDYQRKADVNYDNQIDIIDALLIAQYYVGVINSLPTPPAATPTPFITPDPASTAVPTINPDRLTNPFEEAKWYVDPQWSALASAGGGQAIAGNNTAIWLDHVDDIYHGPGLRQHMINALDQEANLMTLVLYNLPNRGCDDYYYTPSLTIRMNGYEIYAHDYIDPIAEILSDRAFKDIRVVIVLEPRSMAYFVNGGCCERECAEASGPGGYYDSITYALDHLAGISNVYIYLDYANSAWLGWYDQMRYGPQIFLRPVKDSIFGLNSIMGFALNIKDLNPLEESYLPDPDLKIQDQPIRSSTFYEWNEHFDELDFADDLYELFIAQGMREDFGFIIDTSRNGWGGPDRPSGPSDSNDLETFVNDSRIDRRQHRANICNIVSGIGEPPQSNPYPHVHGYIWAWPPGYSDGASKAEDVNPDSDRNYFNPICDPYGQNYYNREMGTDAFPDAPAYGMWNQAYFQALLENAYPPIICAE